MIAGPFCMANTSCEYGNPETKKKEQMYSVHTSVPNRRPIMKITISTILNRMVQLK